MTILLNEEKLCASCQKNLTCAAFNLNPDLLGGLEFICRSCQAIQEHKQADIAHNKYLETREKQLNREAENKFKTENIAHRTRHRKHWSPDEDDTLIHSHAHMHPATLGTILGRTYNSVISRTHVLKEKGHIH